MRSAYTKSKSELKKIAIDEARKELEKFQEETCEKCMTNMGYQTLATVFLILHRCYGWGTKRLNALKDYVEDEFDRMEQVQRGTFPGLGRMEYSGNDIVKWLKAEMGVDFEQSQFKKEGENAKG